MHLFKTRIAAASLLLGGNCFAASIGFVTTNSSIFSGGTAINYDSLTGLSPHQGSCFLQGGGTGPCATLSSNPATNTLGLTSASVAITNGQGFDPQNGSHGTGAAFATANLATGSVGVSSSGAGFAADGTPAAGSSFGAAKAQIQDSITFNNTTGGVAGIGVSWKFDGSVTNGPGIDRQLLDFVFCMTAGTTCFGSFPVLASDKIFRYQEGSVSGPTASTILTPSAGWVSTLVTPGANGTSYTFSGVLAVATGLSTDSLNAFLSVDCGNGASCDFGHTGTLSLTLPTGVSFTSGSGVLLSQQVSGAPTPEPATWAMLAGALCLFAVRGRFRVR